MGIINLVLLLILAIGKCGSVFVNKDLPHDDFYQAGDILLGGLLPLWRSSPGNQCKARFVPAYIQCAHAIKYVIDDVNRSPDLLPNVTLGFAILNDCARSTVSVARATQFLPLEKCAEGCYDKACRRSYDVVGIVGPVTSDWNIAVANLLGPYQIPQIGWIATGNQLSDKVDYEYFSRTVPADSYQAKALVDLIHYYNWTYVAVLNANTEYGRDGTKYVMAAAKLRGVCVAFNKEVHPEAKDAEFDATVQELAKIQNLKIIILYMYWPQNRKFLEALKRASMSRRLILVSAETMTPDAYSGLEDVALGTFSTHPKSQRIGGFEEYYTSISPWREEGGHPWHGQYTPETAGCGNASVTDVPSCSNYQRVDDFPDFYWTTYYPLIMDATLTFAQALHQYITSECNHLISNKTLLRHCLSGPKLLQYIRNVSFHGYVQHIEFDKNGDLVGGYDIKYMMKNQGKAENVLVGMWDRATAAVVINEVIPWYVKNDDDVSNMSVPDGACAQPCAVGEYRVVNDAPCCWECRRCSHYEFLSNDGCQRCPDLSWPDQVTYTSCLPITPIYIKWNDSLSIALEALTAFCIIITIVVSGLFIYHRNTKIMRGSGRDLMIPIIVGIYLSYVCVFAFLSRPNHYSCIASFSGFHISCTFIFGPLFLKTLRIYRIFEAGKKCVNISGINQRCQLIATSSVVLCQVCILMCLFFMKQPSAELEMPFPDLKYVTLQCHLPTIDLVIPLALNLLLLLLCAVFGFLTRRLPENFSESWYIFISVTTNLFIWIAFIPTYFIAVYTYYRAALLSFALVLSATVILLCLFFPKVYAIYFVDEAAIKVTLFRS